MCIAGQVNILWEQTTQLNNHINSIPNLTNNLTEAMSLYSGVSAFNTTVFFTLSQLESVSIQANNILMNLTEIVSINMDHYANEVNELLQLLQNVNEAQTHAAIIERVARAHQERLNNITAQLQGLMTNVSRLDAQVQHLGVGVAKLQQLAINIQQLRLIITSLLTTANNDYASAVNALQSARQQLTTAVNLEQAITRQLQVYSYIPITTNISCCDDLFRLSQRG